MTDEVFEALLVLIRDLAARQIETEARADALQLVLTAVASRTDLAPMEVEALLRNSREICHRMRLRDFARENPAMADLLDPRTGPEQIRGALLRLLDHRPRAD